MKHLFLYIILLVSLPLTGQIFMEGIVLTDTNGVAIDLKDVALANDSVLLVLWGEHCPPCIKKLNAFKQQQRQNTLQIIAITRIKKTELKKINAMIAKNEWPFQFYYDVKSVLITHLIKNKLMPSKYYRYQDGDYSYRVPQSYLFINGRFVGFGVI